jgi:hypothetical protein
MASTRYASPGTNLNINLDKLNKLSDKLNVINVSEKKCSI